MNVQSLPRVASFELNIQVTSLDYVVGLEVQPGLNILYDVEELMIRAAEAVSFGCHPLPAVMLSSGCQFAACIRGPRHVRFNIENIGK